MFTLPIRSFRWSVAHPRSFGVAGAFAAMFYLGVATDPQIDIFGVLTVVLSSLEVSMFAVILAIYRDSIPDAEDWVKGLGALPIWFGVCLAIMWLNLSFVRAGIEAYARFGVPQAFDFVL
jgi:hypothetical protein